MQDKNQDGTIKHILAYDYIKMRNKKSSSIVHRKLAKEITECLGSSTEEYAAEYLKSLSKVMGACIRELSDLEKFESLQVLGLNMTYANINNTMVAFVSITLTCYEIFGNDK